MENRPVIAKVGGWTGSLGLIDSTITCGRGKQQDPAV